MFGHILPPPPDLPQCVRTELLADGQKRPQKSLKATHKFDLDFCIVMSSKKLNLSKSTCKSELLITVYLHVNMMTLMLNISCEIYNVLTT